MTNKTHLPNENMNEAMLHFHDSLGGHEINILFNVLLHHERTVIPVKNL